MFVATFVEDIRFFVMIGALSGLVLLICACARWHKGIWKVITSPFRFVWPEGRTHKVQNKARRPRIYWPG